MRLLASIIVLAGLVVLLYPQWSEWRADREQAALLAEAAQAVDSSPRVSTSASAAEGLKRLSELLNDGDNDESEPSSDEAAADAADHLIGTIAIDRIDLKLPILEGATKANMKHAATRLTETSPLGSVGNTAIAAHRARKTGRLFNRLNEVGIGDKIDVQTSEAAYRYVVYSIKVVKPTDVTVLNRNARDSILTLITCDPLVNPTHRLIVQAKLESQSIKNPS